MSSAAAKKKETSSTKKEDDGKKSSSDKKPAADKAEKGGEKKKNEFENEPPFGVDYAKTGRSKCKTCNEGIEKGKLRIATRAPSYRYHGMMENWYHDSCFPWEKAITDGITEAKIRGIDTIEKDAREKILKKISETSKSVGQKLIDSSSTSEGTSKRKRDDSDEEISTKKVKKSAGKSDEKKKH